MKRTVRLSFYVIIFLIFALIGYWMPMVGDDLNWWSGWGRQYFQSGNFTYYDGRYLGDLLIISMMKFKFIAFLAYGTFPTLIIYLIQKIREEIRPTNNIGLISAGITTLMFLLAPKLIFRQIWGWHSGFANYVPSVVFPLFLLYLVVKNIDNKNSKYLRTSTLLIFFAALFAQFFAEHITLLNCFNILLVWLLFRKRFSASFKKIIYVIMGGNFLGAILMFINGAYLKILIGSDAYRHVNGTEDTLLTYFQNYFSASHIIIGFGIIIIAALVAAFFSYRLSNKKQAITNIGLILSGVVSVVPFIVISPFGSRCIFAAYAFGTALVAINLDILLDAYQKYLFPIITIALIAVGLKFDYIANDYGNTFNIAINYSGFQTTANRKTYYIPSYKNTDYIWSNDTSNDPMFKAYYIIHKDNPVKPISYADWTDALKIVNKSKYKSNYFFMYAFDKQVQSKINK
ncbi:hypothetical protein M5C72_02970 [Companilactobacillus allii]|uniref:Teichoic acid polysaccharide export protein n=1 Tax=Companilactobacillus allii TaxID=1847728 RepID=A0A1P8Q2U3_9LACO|nr:hypothetical protein [Companilactobacillus allii]APX72119.1 hypothetical protein BTM29_05895 [Companilactobacillus allii]USQ69215.1 hypothetical protein M5C72_02970 [Companilactobacillus allii]